MKKVIRKITCSFVGKLLIGLGFTRRLMRKAKNGEYILSIYFHSPSKELFEFCIKWLLRNHFVFLSQNDVEALILKQKSFPKGAVIVTVDDGWQSNDKNIVDVIKKYQVPLTLFVSTEPVEAGNFWWTYISQANKKNLVNISIPTLKNLPNYEREVIVDIVKKKLKIDRSALTVSQLQNISKSELVTIGGHTVSHPVLTNCEDDVVKYELEESKRKIENWTDKKVTCFAYPNGDYDEREITYLSKLGYSSAYTTQPLFFTKSTLNQAFELPRFCIFENISEAEAICRMLGLWQQIF